MLAKEMWTCQWRRIQKRLCWLQSFYSDPLLLLLLLLLYHLVMLLLWPMLLLLIVWHLWREAR